MALFFQEWSSQFKTYNQNIKLAIWANICSQIGMGMFMVMYNIYIQELGLSHEVNGQVIALTALATAIILVPAGIMSDKFGRKRVMTFGVVLSGVILFLRSTVEDTKSSITYRVCNRDIHSVFTGIFHSLAS